MPQSQEKTSEPETELPNPELNPLLNPTLGRHLGRWAQVYFTSPPEKREEAVGELLRELQGEPGVAHEQIVQDQSADTQTPIEPPETIRIVEAPIAEPPVLQCTECGHPYSNPQRFCGMCGAALQSAPPRHFEVVRAATTAVEPAFTHSDLAGFSPVHESSSAPDDSFSDIRWLREKGLIGENGSSWKRIGSRFAPAIVATLAIGILFYAQSRSQTGSGSQAGRTAKAAPATSENTSAQSTASAAAPSPMASAPVKTSEETPENTAVDRTSAPPPTTLAKEPPQAAQAPSRAGNQQTAAEHVPTLPPAEGTAPKTPLPTQAFAPNPMNGAAELALAEDFLNGRTHPRNSEEAAKYLWRAVGKENPSAILLLSDMYLVGDGVPKSCDQARLLLSAAARKGVPQAADKLRDLLRSGCPK